MILSKSGTEQKLLGWQFISQSLPYCIKSWQKKISITTAVLLYLIHLLYTYFNIFGHNIFHYCWK